MRISLSGRRTAQGMRPVRSCWAGGRWIRRPRARRAGTEVPLPTVRAFTDADPLNRRVVDQMLIGVATRQYARSLDPLGADVTTRGTSKRAVSRRFVAQAAPTPVQRDVRRGDLADHRRVGEGHPAEIQHDVDPQARRLDEGVHVTRRSLRTS